MMSTESAWDCPTVLKRILYCWQYNIKQYFIRMMILCPAFSTNQQRSLRRRSSAQEIWSCHDQFCHCVLCILYIWQHLCMLCMLNKLLHKSQYSEKMRTKILSLDSLNWAFRSVSYHTSTSVIIQLESLRFAHSFFMNFSA